MVNWGVRQMQTLWMRHQKEMLQVAFADLEEMSNERFCLLFVDSHLS